MQNHTFTLYFNLEILRHSDHHQEENYKFQKHISELAHGSGRAGTPYTEAISPPTNSLGLDSWPMLITVDKNHLSHTQILKRSKIKSGFIPIVQKLLSSYSAFTDSELQCQGCPILQTSLFKFTAFNSKVLY